MSLAFGFGDKAVDRKHVFSDFSGYIEMLEKVRLYDTGVELTPEDKTLTLQTCVSGYTGQIYEILVLKLLDTETY